MSGRKQRRDSVLYDFRGERLSLPEIARRTGIKAITLYQRIKRNGQTVEEAVAAPVRRYGNPRPESAWPKSSGSVFRPLGPWNEEAA